MSCTRNTFGGDSPPPPPDSNRVKGNVPLLEWNIWWLNGGNHPKINKLVLFFQNFGYIQQKEHFCYPAWVVNHLKTRDFFMFEPEDTNDAQMIQNINKVDVGKPSHCRVLSACARWKYNAAVYIDYSGYHQLHHVNENNTKALFSSAIVNLLQKVQKT